MTGGELSAEQRAELRGDSESTIRVLATVGMDAPHHERVLALLDALEASEARAEKAEALVEAGLAAVGHECLDFSRGCASVYPDQADRWCHVCSVRAALGGTE
jgi:hypothetical protein